jgi:hypothetical protein
MQWSASRPGRFTIRVKIPGTQMDRRLIWNMYMSKISGMIVRNFEVIYGKFNLVGICTDGNNCAEIVNIAYVGVSKSFRTESRTKYTRTFGITRCCPLQRIMAAKLTRLTYKIAIQLHLVAESYTICSSRSRRPSRKVLDTASCSSCCPHCIEWRIWS